MKIVNVKSVLGQEQTPSNDGYRLAEHLLSERMSLANVILDVTDLAPEDLVSSFVNAFLFRLQQANVDVARAPGISWRTRFPSEAERLSELVRLYIEDDSA